MDDVDGEEQRDMEPALLDRDALELPGVRGTLHTEERSDPAGAQTGPEHDQERGRAR